MNRRRFCSEGIVEIVQKEWARTRPPGGGDHEQRGRLRRLAAEAVDVPRRVVARAIEALWNEVFVEGIPYRGRSGKATRGARPIIEAKWHAD